MRENTLKRQLYAGKAAFGVMCTFSSPVFSDVALLWYMWQGERPLVGTRGQLYNHIALSVTDLDAWVTRLRGEGVTFLDAPYKLGDTRAVMVEGPSPEALELVEVA